MPKTAVLVIDMQKDFTRPEGRFYYPETTGEMMKTFPEKLNKMRDLGALVVIVYTAHPADEKEVNPELTRMFRDGKKASLVEGSAGAELEERIPYDPERDIMFRKFVPSAFLERTLPRFCVSAAWRTFLCVASRPMSAAAQPRPMHQPTASAPI